MLKLYICCFYYLLLSFSVQSQSLSSIIIKNIQNNKSTNGSLPPRSNLKIKAKPIWKVPFLFGSKILISTYQNVISEQIQAGCSYEISCSEFIKKEVSEQGLIKGILFGLNQYTNCVPNNYKHHFEHAISNKLKIQNKLYHEIY